MKVNIYPSDMYTFKYEVGLTSDSIDFVDTDRSVGGVSEISVIAAYQGRNHILKMTEEVNANRVGLDHTGFNITTTGCIEFLHYIFMDADLPDITFFLYDGAVLLAVFRLDISSGFKLHYEVGGGEQDVCTFSSNGWYFFSIRCDVAAGVNGQFDCYVYDASYTEVGSVTGIEFWNNSADIDTFRIDSEGKAGFGNSFYFDCFGFTGEGYTQGDNQYAEVDLSDYMNDNRIYDAILPGKKRFTFTAHPTHYSYFNVGDYIDIFDDSGNLLFAGWIKIEPQKVGDKFECPGMANEVFERTYDKSYSGDDTDTKQKDIIDNALKFCYRSTSIVGTTTTYDYEYNRACVYLFNLARFLERQVGYIEPDGKLWTKAYNGLAASGKSWTLGDGNQQVQLIDIPGINEKTPGYYKGNLGITSVSVRYKDNTVVVRPATPSETFVKKRLKEFRDPKIKELATAQQIGDNLYAIFSLETEFICLRGEGLGWLQPGETVEIENARQITIAKAHRLLQRVIYDPKNDIHHLMIFSNNIITPREFKSEFDTSGQQIHTAVLQSSENQANISVENYMEYDDDDPAAHDIIQTDLTIDGAWHECDLDGFKTVPSHAIGFSADLTIRDTAGGNLKIDFRHTSQSNVYQAAAARTQGTGYFETIIPIPLDSNHKFDYRIAAGMDTVQITVVWWIRAHT